MARRCKNGFRRGTKKCRKTKCKTYITKAGYCAKAGGWYRGSSGGRKKRRGSRRSSSSRASGKKELSKQYLWFAEAEYAKARGLPFNKPMPGLIGNDAVSRRNARNPNADRNIEWITRYQNARGRSPGSYGPMPSSSGGMTFEVPGPRQGSLF